MCDCVYFVTSTKNCDTVSQVLQLGHEEFVLNLYLTINQNEPQNNHIFFTTVNDFFFKF